MSCFCFLVYWWAFCMVWSGKIHACVQSSSADSNNPPCQIQTSDQSTHARVTCTESSYENVRDILSVYGNDLTCTALLELIIDNGKAAWNRDDYNPNQIKLQEINMALLTPVKSKLSRILLRNFFRDLTSELASGALSGIDNLQVIKLENIQGLKFDKDWLPNNFEITVESVVFESIVAEKMSERTWQRIRDSPKRPCLYVSSFLFPCNCSNIWLNEYITRNYPDAKPLVTFSSMDQNSAASPFATTADTCGFVDPANVTCHSPRSTWTTRKFQKFMTTDCKLGNTTISGSSTQSAALVAKTNGGTAALVSNVGIALMVLSGSLYNLRSWLVQC